MLLDHSPDPQELLALLADILPLILGIPATELVEVRELSGLVQTDELLRDPGDLAWIAEEFIRLHEVPSPQANPLDSPDIGESESQWRES